MHVESLIIGLALGLALHPISQMIIAAWRDEHAPIVYRIRHLRFHMRSRWGQLATMLILSTIGSSVAFASLSGLALVLSMVFLAVILLMVFIDLHYYLLPDWMTIGLLFLGLAISSIEPFITTKAAIIGALAGFFSLFFINITFKAIRKKDGIGMGDMKLLAALGAWMGAELLPLVMVLAGISGVIFALIRQKIGRESTTQPFPFGPMIGLAGFVVLLHGQAIMTAYGNWLMGLLY